MADRTISEARFYMATDAILEIEQILAVLRKYIVEVDACGVVRPLARGMLRRLNQLNGAISDCIGDPDNMDEQQIKADIYDEDGDIFVEPQAEARESADTDSEADHG